MPAADLSAGRLYTYKGSIDLPSANAGGEKNTDGVRTSYSMPVTTVTVETYDISDREKPKKTGVYHQDGSYLPLEELTEECIFYIIYSGSRRQRRSVTVLCAKVRRRVYCL